MPRVSFYKCLFVVLFFIIICSTVSASAQVLKVDIIYPNESGTAYVPLRQTCEQLGYSVDWKPDIRTVYVTDDGVLIGTYETSNQNNSVIIDGRLFVSIDKFSEIHDVYFASTDKNSYDFIIRDEVNAEDMMKTIEEITETPRQYGGKEINKSRNFITESFDSFGYNLSKQVFSYEQEEIIFLEGHEDTVPDNWTEGIHYKFENVTRTGQNIIATKYPESINKTDDILIVCAHYDSVMNSPGANDNGSGVAVLLEIAKQLKDMPSDVELRLIAFDGEENLLLGSYFYVQSLTDGKLSRLIGVINFDMFASNEIDNMKMTTIDGKHNYLSEMFDGFELRTKSSSDHISFASAAIPTVSISHEADSKNHQPEDTLEYIDKEKLCGASEKGIEAISRIMSDATSSFNHVQQADENIVHHLKLTDELPFFQPIEVVEGELGITVTQVPVKTKEPFEATLNFVTMIDWWGEPLKTHFIYDFNVLSATMLSYIKIELGQKEDIKTILDDNFFYVNNIEDHTFFYMESKDIADVWVDNEKRAFIINENNGKPELIITEYEVNQ